MKAETEWLERAMISGQDDRAFRNHSLAQATRSISAVYESRAIESPQSRLAGTAAEMSSELALLRFPESSSKGGGGGGGTSPLGSAVGAAVG